MGTYSLQFYLGSHVLDQMVRSNWTWTEHIWYREVWKDCCLKIQRDSEARIKNTNIKQESALLWWQYGKIIWNTIYLVLMPQECSTRTSRLLKWFTFWYCFKYNGNLEALNMAIRNYSKHPGCRMHQVKGHLQKRSLQLGHEIGLGFPSDI
jgi:hypothetical protein